MDPYQVLGIRPDADTGQIRAAYRGRARHVHPDAGGDDDAFARLQDAYHRALQLRSARRSAPPPPTGSSARPGPAGSGWRRAGWLPAARQEMEEAVGRLWARHQLSVVAMLATQVVVLSAVVLTGPPSSPVAAVAAALLVGVGAGYAVLVVDEGDRWLTGRRRRTGRATPPARWWRANGRRRR